MHDMPVLLAVAKKRSILLEGRCSIQLSYGRTQFQLSDWRIHGRPAKPLPLYPVMLSRGATAPQDLPSGAGAQTGQPLRVPALPRRKRRAFRKAPRWLPIKPTTLYYARVKIRGKLVRREQHEHSSVAARAALLFMQSGFVFRVPMRSS